MKRGPIVLRSYQQRIVGQGLDILDRYGILYLAMETRTGKTFTALTIAKLAGAERVMFVTKKMAMESIKDDHKALGEPFAMNCINYASAKKIEDGHDLIIIDEAHNLGMYPKPSKTRFFEMLRRCWKCPRVIFLSATPSPESYCQLFHQFNVSGRSPWASYMKSGGQNAFYKWARSGYVNVKQKRIGGGALVNDWSEGNKDKILNDVRHLFIRLTQAEAGFVDGGVNETIHRAPMSDAQRDLFDQISRHGVANYVNDDGEHFVATCSNAADVLNKLRQISAGTLIFDPIEGEGKPRPQILSTTAADFVRRMFAGQKIAIFYIYKAERVMLEAMFENTTDVPEEFNAGAQDLVFLGQVKSASEGVNLSTADALIMLNIDFSARAYTQSKARIQYKERETTNLHWIFATGGIQPDVFDAVAAKHDFTAAHYERVKRVELDLFTYQNQ